MGWPCGGGEQAGPDRLGQLRQVLIPSLHEGQNPLVIASEGARSPTGRSAPPQREVGKMRRMHPVSAAVLGAVVALIAVVAYGECRLRVPSDRLRVERR
jgi:hypothetical protein